VLDFSHRITLRAARKGEGKDTPAMQSLLATGLVGRSADGGYVLTPAGEAALEASKPSRLEMSLWWVFAVCVAMVAIATIIGWVT
jgi:hypothetical protein